MMRITKSWIPLIASRWFTKGTDTSSSFIPAAAGIAIGVTALIVVISVMNGFQLGFIEAVLELDSYHVRIVNYPGFPLEEVRALPGVRGLVRFSEKRTMVRNRGGIIVPVKIKYLYFPDDELGSPDFLAQLNLIQGGFDGDSGVLIGNELARQLRIADADRLSVLDISSSEIEGLDSSLSDVQVSGVFNSSYYEYDTGLVFVWGNTELSVPLEPEYIGIKLDDRFQDIRVMEQLLALGVPPGRLESWRTYNKAFFGALRMEKTVMLLLIGIIFLVVGVNIFHAMRKIIFERMDEIAILKAIGGRVYAVRYIFVLNGLVTGVIGSYCGLIAGLLVARYMNAIARIIERGAGLVSGITGLPAFMFFSSDIFYTNGIPVRIIYTEVLFITLAGIMSAIMAAWYASGRIASFRPAEVLRHE